VQNDPATALFNDAVDQARLLKRKHRAFFESDHEGFRAGIRKAHSRVLRLKPGPKADPQIAVAARERALGANWEDLYPRFIPHHSQMLDFTRGLAEAGFQRKVNTYLQRHPVLRLKWGSRTVDGKRPQ
jgi:hypothetical protein